MCHHTPVLLRCTSPKCRKPGQYYKLTTAVDYCRHFSDPRTREHDIWPCSKCKKLGQPKLEEWSGIRPRPPLLSGTNMDRAAIGHTIPIEHFVSQEPKVVWRHGICKDCESRQDRSKSSSSANAHEALSFPDRCAVYAEQARLNDRGVPTARNFGAVLEQTRVEYGYSPHTFAIAIVYAASHLSTASPRSFDNATTNNGDVELEDFTSKPRTKTELVKLFEISRELLDHAYEKVFESRRQLFGVLSSQKALDALPKPCCGRSQKQRCPTEWTRWNSEVVVCTGKQIPDVKAWYRFEAWQIQESSDHGEEAWYPSADQQKTRGYFDGFGS